MRILIFGTGKMYECHKHELSHIPIVAFLDNDISKQGKLLDGVIIESPSNICQYSYDYIFILSVHYREMREQLLREGVSGDKIIDQDHKGFFEDLFEIKFYLKEMNSSNNKKKILLCSHDLSLAGAQMVLYYVATLLKEQYSISVFSKLDGPLRYDFMKLGISVVVCKDISVDNWEIYKFFDRFDLLFVNTLVFFNDVNNMAQYNKPVLWWLHEEKNLYDDFGISGTKPLLNKNIYPYSVSTCSDAAFYQCYNAEIKRMRYGIPYENNKCTCQKKDKLIFAIIGTVEKRKAQDLFVEAIKKLNGKLDEAEFWIIGQIVEHDRIIFEKEKRVKVFGQLSHEQVMELYSGIDVIVCPSLYDPLPVVLTEGMMLKKVCIMSDMTGTAEIVEQYKSGLICKSGDADDLAEKMLWVIDNKDKLAAIREEAYNVYEKYFSLKQFKNNLINNINNLLNMEIKKI